MINFNNEQISSMVKKYLDHILLPNFPEIIDYQLKQFDKDIFKLTFTIDGTDEDQESEIIDSVFDMKDYLSIGSTKILVDFTFGT